MRLKDGALFAVKVQGVVFKERTSLRKTLSHEPHRTVEGGRFPVAFRTETVTFGHQALAGQSRKLVDAFQVVEVGRKGFGAFVRQQTAEGDLRISRIPDLFHEVFITPVGRTGGIRFPVCFHQSVHFGFRHFILVSDQFGDGAIVHVVAQTHFRIHLIAVGYGYVVHLVAETYDKHVLGIRPGGGYAHPYGNLFLGGRILPVAGYYFAGGAHTGRDVPEFTVAMGRLVQVHKVHIHGIPGDFFVELRMEMTQRLFKFLQAMYPHFSRREGVHPGDHTDTCIVIIGGLEGRRYFF